MKLEITKTVKTDRHVVKLLSSVVIENSIIPAGSFVEVSPFEAKDLIGRKRAIDITAEEAAANSGDIIVAPNRAQMKEWKDA